MLADSQVTKYMWPEALLTANYLRNRSPISISNSTPIQLLTGSKPTVHHLRVFGSPVSIKLAQPDTKLSPLAESGIFVGYDLSTTNYRIYLPTQRKVVVSPNVKFYETETSVSLPTPETPPTTVTLPDIPQAAVTAPVTAPPSTPTPHPLPPSPVQSPTPSFQSPVPVTPDSVSMPVRTGRLDSFQSSTPNLSTGETPAPGGNSAAADAAGASRYPVRNRAAPVRFAGAARYTDNVTEPMSYEEAIASPQAAEWKLAMDEELASMYANRTWELSAVSAGTRILPVKWVFKVKRGSDGRIQRFKARLVAKGFRQVEGVDYGEVFAPVSKHTTLRVLLSIVAAQDLELDQLDVKTAFLNGDLEEELYMQQPPGFEQGGPNIACRLQKAIYGLKQAPKSLESQIEDRIGVLGVCRV